MNFHLKKLKKSNCTSALIMSPVEFSVYIKAQHLVIESVTFTSNKYCRAHGILSLTRFPVHGILSLMHFTAHGIMSLG